MCARIPQTSRCAFVNEIHFLLHVRKNNATNPLCFRQRDTFSAACGLAQANFIPGSTVKKCCPAGHTRRTVPATQTVTVTVCAGKPQNRVSLPPKVRFPHAGGSGGIYSNHGIAGTEDTFLLRVPKGAAHNSVSGSRTVKHSSRAGLPHVRSILFKFRTELRQADKKLVRPKSVRSIGAAQKLTGNVIVIFFKYRAFRL